MPKKKTEAEKAKKKADKPKEKRVVSEATKRLMRRSMTKYKPSYAGELIDWFSGPKCGDKWKQELDIQYTTPLGNLVDAKMPVYIPTLTGFCESIGVSLPTLYKWIDLYDEMYDAYAEAMELKRELIQSYALRKAIEPTFAKYMLESWKPHKTKREISAEETIKAEAQNELTKHTDDNKLEVVITIKQPVTSDNTGGEGNGDVKEA